MPVFASTLLVAALAVATPPVVSMSVEAGAKHPISRFIYGINFGHHTAAWGKNVPRGITLSRMGGNRMSAYNWEINASNCGNDCGKAYQNDTHLGTGSPGAPVRKAAEWAFGRDAGFLATVPMLGWVSGDTSGPVPLTLPLAARLERFKQSKARKGAPFVYPPDTTDAFVYQDEFVSWLENTFPKARTDPAHPIFYSLDNEPDLWGSTHEEVRGNRLAEGKYVLTEYDELVERSIETAAAIKDVAPGALVFGPALSNWNGYQNLYHNEPIDRLRLKFFLNYYLAAMRKAGEARGKRLLDVLDVHWYAEIQSANYQALTNEWTPQDAQMIQSRVQAPRSLWDPTFKERSWVSRVLGGPVRLLPRLREIVDAEYPGTRLAITEYFWYRAGDISGAIAQADSLGIFGREDVFAATLWGQGGIWAYKGDVDKTYHCAFAAFRAYRDYDGKGSAFGDVSLGATTADNELTSIYASSDSKDPSRVVLVVLNKSASPLTADVALPGAIKASKAAVWQIVGEVGKCDGPERVPGDTAIAGGKLALTLPSYSVSTVVLLP